MPIPRLMPALITPFDSAGEIDESAFRANLETLWDRWVRGFLVAGSTGEGPYLEPGERRRLVALARRTVPAAHLVCGVAAESVRIAAAQVVEATEGGADAVLVITPTTLVRGRDDRVAAFYERVADAADVPVLLYTVPKVTGYGLPIEVIGALAGHPRISGIKDSSGEVGRIGPTRQAAGDGFSISCGSTPVLAEAVAAGADGGITANSNYAFARADAVIKAAAAGSPETGSAALTRLAGAVEQYGIPGVKAAAAMTGLRTGSCRLPLQGPGNEAIDEIRAALEAAGVI